MKPVILIVEDEDVFREVLAATCREEGYTVFSEPNALAALTLMETQSVDIVVTDVRMPGMDGVEFMEKARRQADADVIVMSAYGTSDDVAKALRRGACDYIAKPFLLDEMLHRLQKVSARRGCERPGSSAADAAS